MFNLYDALRLAANLAAFLSQQEYVSDAHTLQLVKIERKLRDMADEVNMMAAE